MYMICIKKANIFPWLRPNTFLPNDLYAEKTCHEPERFPKTRWGFQRFVAPDVSTPPEKLGKSTRLKIIPNRNRTWRKPRIRVSSYVSEYLKSIWFLEHIYRIQNIISKEFESSKSVAVIFSRPSTPLGKIDISMISWLCTSHAPLALLANWRGRTLARLVRTRFRRLVISTFLDILMSIF